MEGIANSVEQGYSMSYNMRIAFTKTGIIVSPAVVVNDQELTEFIYDDSTGSFTAAGTNGVSASIKYTDKPLILMDDYTLLLPGIGNGNNAYAYIHDYTELEGVNSALFLSLLKDIEEANGEPLERAQLWFNNTDGTNYIEYRFGNVSYYHYFTLKADDVNKTITLIPDVWKSRRNPKSPTITPPSFLKALDDEFMSPQGLYFAEIPVVGYRAYTFTSTTTPFRMVAYSFQ